MEAFKKLKKDWYGKLVQSGFVDIENEDGSLKAEVHPRTISRALKDKESREVYYQMAQEFLAIHKFLDRLDKEIWGLHCTGLGARKISRKLEITLSRADTTITRFKRLSGIKK